jgi:hypothetical protein
VIELLAVFFRIREVPGSNIDPVIDYSEGFRGFYQSPHSNGVIVRQIMPKSLPSSLLQSVIH